MLRGHMTCEPDGHLWSLMARTLAELGHAEEIKTAHVAEAIGYRQLDRGGSG